MAKTIVVTTDHGETWSYIADGVSRNEQHDLVLVGTNQGDITFPIEHVSHWSVADR